MSRDEIHGMPTWEASARQRGAVLRAHARRQRAGRRSPDLRWVIALLVFGAATWLVAPWVLEIAAGAGLMALGLLMLLVGLLRPRHLRHPLLDGLLVGGLLGWLVGRRRHR